MNNALLKAFEDSNFGDLKKIKISSESISQKQIDEALLSENIVAFLQEAKYNLFIYKYKGVHFLVRVNYSKFGEQCLDSVDVELLTQEELHMETYSISCEPNHEISEKGRKLAQKYCE